MLDGNKDLAAKVVRISGPISAEAAARLHGELAGAPKRGAFPAGLLVLLDSPGGDGDLAMLMGRQLRKHQAHVFVLRQCDSACVFLLMGGVVRAASPGALGVHAGRLTVLTSSGKVVREVDASQSLSGSFQLAGFNRDIRLYLREMGIGHGILDVMLAHQTPEVYRIPAPQASFYQVTGVDPETLKRLVDQAQGANPSQSPDAATLVRRAMSVPVQCKNAALGDAAFLACYRRVLLNG